MSVPGGRSASRSRGRSANLNSSWPQDVSTGGIWSASRSRGRSAKFELILTMRCQYQRGRSVSRSRVDLPNLNSSWPWDVSTGGRSASRSRGRSAKFELILTTRCQYQGVDLPADLGVDLPNLNSSWPWDVSTGGYWSASRSRGRSAKFELILTMRCQY